MKIVCFLCAFILCVSADRSLSLIMSGDALLHSRVYKDAAFKDKNSSTGLSYDFSKTLAHLKPIITEYDLAFYNQESILAGKEFGLSSYPNFNAPQEFGTQMLQLGFNLVSLANNHTLDRGEAAVLASLKFWQAQKEVVSAGSSFSFEDQKRLRIKEINGIKVGLLAYTYGVNGHFLPQEKAYLVDIFDKQRAKEDIRRLKKEADLILVSMHWGVEYAFEPNEEQKELASFLAKQGVHIIIGNHSHFISPIEFVDDTLVIYSLGNFISSQIGLNRRIGSLVGVKLSLDEKGRVVFEDIGFELIFTYYDENFKNFKLYPFSLLDDSVLANHKQIRLEFEKIIQSKDKNIKAGLPKF
ncbi:MULTISPECIES: CapA family protein [unclassified Campylobacter]|uniref:CapA family protein n=1 Tax=unclassified Campylobacter TaxID=2593542 RepID=UPI0021AECC0F|nr:CapA family protein [Campylobacter sp. MIT 12-8780]